MHLKKQPDAPANGQPQPTTPDTAANTHTPPEEFSPDELYDSQDMLQKFHISPRTLFNWRSKGMLHFIQLGKKIYYPKKFVEEMLRKHVVRK